MHTLLSCQAILGQSHLTFGHSWMENLAVWERRLSESVHISGLVKGIISESHITYSSSLQEDSQAASQLLTAGSYTCRRNRERGSSNHCEQK